MPRATLKVCRISGCPHLQAGPLCRHHMREHERHQRATVPTKVTRDYEEQQRRRAAVDDHRAINGDWCPGWHRSAHTSTDLTADHVTDIQHGGSPTGPLQVLCRSCNSRKANTRQAPDQHKH